MIQAKQNRIAVVICLLFLVVMTLQKAQGQIDTTKHAVSTYHDPFHNVVESNNPDSTYPFLAYIYPSAFNFNISGGSSQVFGLGLSYDATRFLTLYGEGFYQYPWSLVNYDYLSKDPANANPWHSYKAGGIFYVYSALTPGKEKIDFQISRSHAKALKIDAVHRDKFGIEGSISRYNAMLAGGKNIFGTQTVFTAFNIMDPLQKQISLTKGYATDFSMNYLSAGLVYTQIHHVKVKFDDAMTGVKTKSYNLQIYGGLIYAPYMYYSVITVKDASAGIIPGTYNINDYSNKLKTGFKIGFDFISYQTYVTTGIEAGCLPGPAKTGYYILFKGAYTIIL
jgi:hypothetical protein